MLRARVIPCLLLRNGGLVKTVGYDPFFVALAVFDILAAIWLWTVVKERTRAPAAAAP